MLQLYYSKIQSEYKIEKSVDKILLGAILEEVQKNSVWGLYSIRKKFALLLGVAFL